MTGSVKIFIPIIVFIASLGSVSWFVVDNLADAAPESKELSANYTSHDVGVDPSSNPITNDRQFNFGKLEIDDLEITRRLLAEGLITLPEVIITPDPPVTQEPAMIPIPSVEEIPEPPAIEVLLEEPQPPMEIEPEQIIPMLEINTPVVDQPDVFMPVSYEYSPEPDYPRAAERKGIEGKVLVQVLVGIDGEVREAILIESSGHAMLDESAIDCIRQSWRFHPALRNGDPYEKWAEIPIIFTLN